MTKIKRWKIINYRLQIAWIYCTPRILREIGKSFLQWPTVSLPVPTSLATRCRNPPRMARSTSRLLRSRKRTLVASRRPSRRAPNPRRPTLQLRRLSRIRKVSTYLSTYQMTCFHVVMLCSEEEFVIIFKTEEFLLHFSSEYFIFPFIIWNAED